MPSKPASFIARNFSSTDPFTPMVEYMMALRRSRLDAADAAGAKAAVVALAMVSLRKDRRFIGIDRNFQFSFLNRDSGALLRLQDIVPRLAIHRPLNKR